VNSSSARKALWTTATKSSSTARFEPIGGALIGWRRLEAGSGEGRQEAGVTSETPRALSAVAALWRGEPGTPPKRGSR
jgi:hypothetical protein